MKILNRFVWAAHVGQLGLLLAYSLSDFKPGPETYAFWCFYVLKVLVLDVRRDLVDEAKASEAKP